MLLVTGEAGMVSVHSNRSIGDVVASFENVKLVLHLFSIPHDFFKILQDRK